MSPLRERELRWEKNQARLNVPKMDLDGQGNHRRVKRKAQSAAFNRLFDDAAKRQQNIDSKRSTPEYSFQPDVLGVAPGGAQRDTSEPASDRLFRQAAERKLNLERRLKEKLLQETRECSFRPKLVAARSASAALPQRGGGAAGSAPASSPSKACSRLYAHAGQRQEKLKKLAELHSAVAQVRVRPHQ